MDYRKEINRMLDTAQEPVIRFFCSLLRAVTTDPEGSSVIQYLMQLFGSE